MVCSQHLAWIELSVSCLPSPQLTLPDGTQPCFSHTLTASRVCPGRIHATKFGGSPKWEYHLGKSDDAHLKLAETTVMEFGEYNTHCTLHCIVCSLTHCTHIIAVGTVSLWLEQNHYWCVYWPYLHVQATKIALYTSKLLIAIGTVTCFVA